MITKNTLPEYFERLPQSRIDLVMESDTDEVAMWFSITNAGSIPRLQSFYPDDTELKEEVESTGGIILDKDTFLMLKDETLIKFKENENS